MLSEFYKCDTDFFMPIAYCCQVYFAPPIFVCATKITYNKVIIRINSFFKRFGRKEGASCSSHSPAFFKLVYPLVGKTYNIKYCARK